MYLSVCRIPKLGFSSFLVCRKVPQNWQATSGWEGRGQCVQISSCAKHITQSHHQQIVKGGLCMAFLESLLCPLSRDSKDFLVVRHSKEVGFFPACFSNTPPSPWLLWCLTVSPFLAIVWFCLHWNRTPFAFTSRTLFLPALVLPCLLNWECHPMLSCGLPFLSMLPSEILILRLHPSPRGSTSPDLSLLTKPSRSHCASRILLDGAGSGRARHLYFDWPRSLPISVSAELSIISIHLTSTTDSFLPVRWEMKKKKKSSDLKVPESQWILCSKKERRYEPRRRRSLNKLANRDACLCAGHPVLRKYILYYTLHIHILQFIYYFPLLKCWPYF